MTTATDARSSVETMLRLANDQAKATRRRGKVGTLSKVYAEQHAAIDGLLGELEALDG